MKIEERHEEEWKYRRWTSMRVVGLVSAGVGEKGWQDREVNQ